MPICYLIRSRVCHYDGTILYFLEQTNGKIHSYIALYRQSPLTDTFIRTPTRGILEEISHAENCAKTIRSPIFTTDYGHVLLYAAECIATM